MTKIIPSSWQDMKRAVLTVSFVVAAFFLVLGANGASAQSSDPVQTGSVGITGTISTPPPTKGATISLPVNGQKIDKLPITVAGLCPDNLLVKIFKNNVFGGSIQCSAGNFSLKIDLFVGKNDLVAKVYDALDQPGPNSNSVSITFANDIATTPSRVTLTSNYAKRGANPNETLNWPIILSGGTGPYAFNINWGDGTTPDLFTKQSPGVTGLKHIYRQPGVYNIIAKVGDASGVTAFLQIVGITNGPVSKDASNKLVGSTGNRDTNGTTTIHKTLVLWWPVITILPFMLVAFWLGKRYALYVLKHKA